MVSMYAARVVSSGSACWLVASIDTQGTLSLACDRLYALDPPWSSPEVWDTVFSQQGKSYKP